MGQQVKNIIRPWYNGHAEEAGFYAETFPDSSAEVVHHTPGSTPAAYCSYEWWPRRTPEVLDGFRARTLPVPEAGGTRSPPAR